MSIIKLLNNKPKRTIFTTPSHNQNPVYSKEYKNFYRDDVSELEGYDNLSHPESYILKAQAYVSGVFGTGQTFFVTQGATTAILAAIKTIVNPDNKVLVARNCHKSVFSALVLSCADVDWFMPEVDEDWGIYTHIDTKKLDSTLKLNDYKAFIMTSPTYEGINSDINEIANICRQNNTVLVVDEAHGALYNFSDKLPKTAIEQGADISINSLHKSAGALNQTALLHINKNIFRYQNSDFQSSLNLFHTTSPSYPLLKNIEQCIRFLDSKKGKKQIDSLLSDINNFKSALKDKGVEFYEENHDSMKLLLRKKGVSGNKLSEILFDKYKIEDEMNNSICCLYLTGIGTQNAKLNKLKNALIEVPCENNFEYEKAEFQPHPNTKLKPWQAFSMKHHIKNSEDSLLDISADMIIPYPPGIGILYPGEAIQKWHLKYLDKTINVI